jgi:hypothetical protein
MEDVVICGLLFGQVHMWWRQVISLEWQTPQAVILLCKFLFITDLKY